MVLKKVNELALALLNVTGGNVQRVIGNICSMEVGVKSTILR